MGHWKDHLGLLTSQALGAPGTREPPLWLEGSAHQLPFFPGKVKGNAMMLFPRRITFFFFLLKILLIYFREGKGGEREGEKHQCVVASYVPLVGDLACNPGGCLTGNRTSLGSQAGAQSTELH